VIAAPGILAAGLGACVKNLWWTTGNTASFAAAVRETEEVVPVNMSTWVLPSGVTVGR
jgi:urease subunit gamma